MNNISRTEICVLVAFVTIWANSDQDTTDCQFWKQLAYNLSHSNEQPGGMMSLACNNTCSQLTCSGHLNQLKLPINLKLEMDFCFGVRLNHCDQPVTMDYYLDVADKNISKSGSVAHNDTFEIPGPNFGQGQGTVVVLVGMVRVNTTHILFGIVGKVRIQLPVGGPPLFPYTQKIFPPTYIDVPPCTEAHTTKTPFLGPDKCIPPPPVITPATTKGVTDKPVFINSATYNKSCEYGVFQCSKNEMCATINEKARNGLCICDVDSAFDSKTGQCQPVQCVTDKPVVINSATFNTSCEYGVTQCSKNEICASISEKSRNGLCICDTDSDFDSKTGLCQPKQSMTTTVKPPVTAQPPVTNQPPATVKTTNTPTDKPPVTEANGGKSTQKAGINSVTDKPVVINSATFNTSCEFRVSQCSKNEMCASISEKSINGLCICDTDSDFDSKTGLCQPKQSMTTTVKPLVTAQPPVTKQPPATAKATNTSTDKPPVTEAHGGKSTQKAEINMTGVIMGAVFGGLLLIVVVVSVIICIGRRKRQAYYRGRHQLLTDNDDDDDTNVVI